MLEIRSFSNKHCSLLIVTLFMMLAFSNATAVMQQHPSCSPSTTNLLSLIIDDYCSLTTKPSLNHKDILIHRATDPKPLAHDATLSSPVKLHSKQSILAHLIRWTRRTLFQDISPQALGLIIQMTDSDSSIPTMDDFQLNHLMSVATTYHCWNILYYILLICPPKSKHLDCLQPLHQQQQQDQHQQTVELAAALHWYAHAETKLTLITMAEDSNWPIHTLSSTSWSSLLQGNPRAFDQLIVEAQKSSVRWMETQNQSPEGCLRDIRAAARWIIRPPDQLSIESASFYSAFRFLTHPDINPRYILLVLKHLKSWTTICVLAALRFVWKEVFVPKYSAEHLQIMKIAICNILKSHTDTNGFFSDRMIEFIRGNWASATPEQLIVYHSLQQHISSLPNLNH